MTKTDQLRQIRDEVLNLISSPLYQYRKENKYYPVIGEGNHDAKIIFIGEAPGETEAKTARPFCGAAGKVLDELLASINLDRKSVYVTNIVKDRPPGNRDPLPSEIAFYSPFLLRQITIIEPKVIATLGRFSMQWILETFHSPQSAGSISNLHGQLLPITTEYGEAVVIPLYHPAVALYKAASKEILMQDFQVLKSFI